MSRSNEAAKVGNRGGQVADHAGHDSLDGAHVAVHQAHGWESPGQGVSIELGDGGQMVGVLEDGVDLDGRGGGVREVVQPRDLVPGQLVPDGAVGRIDIDAVEVGRDHPRRRTRYQVPSVGVGLGRHRAEPPVGQGESLGQRVVEGQIVLGVIAHGAGSGLGEAAHLPIGDLNMGIIPGLAARIGCPDLTGLVVHVHPLVVDGVPVDRLLLLVEAEAIGLGRPDTGSMPR